MKNRARGEIALELALAMLKRGFVTFPRLVIDYALELDLRYELLGKLIVLLAEPEVVAQDSFPLGEYRIEIPHPDRFRITREWLRDLEQEDLVRFEEGPGAHELTFDFRPLLSRLMANLAELSLQSQASAQVAAAAATAALSPGSSEPAARGMPDSGDQTTSLRATNTASFLDQVQVHNPLLRYAQDRLGRPLGDREVADIIDWVVTYGFEDRVVKAIVDEGVDRGITRFSYLNQIARRWHEEGVRTFADAERERGEYRRTLSQWGRVISHLGLSRRLTRAEQRLLEKWSGDWGFVEAVILRACDETIYTKEPNFAYIDKVLEGWRGHGVQTVADAEKLVNRKKRQRGKAGLGLEPAGPRSVAAAAGTSNVILRRSGHKGDDWHEQFIKKPEG